LDGKIAIWLVKEMGTFESTVYLGLFLQRKIELIKKVGRFYT
jgi:hypothetical protein